MNKLSLVGMQLPEKYKENFDVSSEGPSSGVLTTFPQSWTSRAVTVYYTLCVRQDMQGRRNDVKARGGGEIFVKGHF